MRKHILTVLAAAMIASVMVPGSVYAADYETEVINNVSIGNVNISLYDYEIDDAGREVEYVNYKRIHPGQTVSKITRITNEAEDAWVRIKPEWFGDEEMGLSDVMLGGILDDWIKVGDYWYYTNILPSGDSVDFCRTLTFPTEWGNEIGDKSFRLRFTADAVQSDNFEPDWSAKDTDPWFGTEIEKSLHEHSAMVEGEESVFSVEFEGVAEGLVRVGDDFFINWGSLMPGDTMSGEVSVGNIYEKPVQIWFHTEKVDDSELLGRLILTIRNGDIVIFRGTMDKVTDGKILLGTFAKDEKTKLVFTVHVPEELKNKFAMTKAKTKWVFECSLEDERTPERHRSGGGGGSSGGSKPRTGNATDQTKPDDTEVIPIVPPLDPDGSGFVTDEGSGGKTHRGKAGIDNDFLLDTGDRIKLGTVLISFVISLVCIAAFFKRRREEKRHEKVEE